MNEESEKTEDEINEVLQDQRDAAWLVVIGALLVIVLSIIGYIAN